MKIRYILPLFLATTPAFAHIGGDAGSHHLVSGFTHPFNGLDHVLAMLAVGIVAAMLGGRARLGMPFTFISAMFVGFLLGNSGWFTLPAYEAMIMASVIGMGLVLLLARPLPLPLVLGMTGIFGLAHGFAHGIEGTATLTYAGGFMAATGLLHLAGFILAFIATQFQRSLFYRLSGGVLTIAGLALALA